MNTALIVVTWQVLECERLQFARNGIDRTLCIISCYLDDAKTYSMLYICGFGAFSVTFFSFVHRQGTKGTGCLIWTVKGGIGPWTLRGPQPSPQQFSFTWITFILTRLTFSPYKPVGHTVSQFISTSVQLWVNPSCKVGFLLCVFFFCFFLCSFCHPIYFIRIFEMCLRVQAKGSGFRNVRLLKSSFWVKSLPELASHLFLVSFSVIFF